MDAANPDPPATDGRRARSERSRAAIVDAFLDLLREGGPRPSSSSIAERAGVTQRTLFNHFEDMDALVLAATARQTERVVRLLPDAGEGTLEERVASWCRSLAVLLEETMHVRWAAVAGPGAPTGAVSDSMELGRTVVRDRLEAGFGAELDAMPDDVRDRTLSALLLLADPVVWRTQRVLHGLDAATARAVVATAMLALLAGPR